VQAAWNGAAALYDVEEQLAQDCEAEECRPRSLSLRPQPLRESPPPAVPTGKPW